MNKPITDAMVACVADRLRVNGHAVNFELIRTALENAVEADKRLEIADRLGRIFDRLCHCTADELLGGISGETRKAFANIASMTAAGSRVQIIADFHTALNELREILLNLRVD